MSLYSTKNIYLSFNQDYKCFGVAHQSGYMFYKTVDVLGNDEKPLDFTGEVELGNSQLNVSNCKIVERLFSTGLLMVVTRSDPRAVQVYRMTTRQLITQHRFSKAVVAVKINKDRLVVLLEDSIHIFDLSTMKKIHTIANTAINNKAVLDMSTATGTALIAFPENNECGVIHIYDAYKLRPVTNIKAHEARLACIKFNTEGTMVATASERGTVIRVFSVLNEKMIHEFRRGATRFVSTTSMCFSADSRFLCSASNTETVHVYKLDQHKKNDAANSVSSISWTRALKSVTNYMPSTVKNVSDLITGDRSHAFARLPIPASGAQVAITTFHNHNYVIVATLDGQVYAFRLLENGGEIPLMFQHSIGAEPVSNRVEANEYQKPEQNENSQRFDKMRT